MRRLISTRSSLFRSDTKSSSSPTVHPSNYSDLPPPSALPFEILEDIIMYAYEDHCPTTPSYALFFDNVVRGVSTDDFLLKGQAQHLRFLCVSKFWYNAGIHLLYRRPVIGSRKSARKLIQTLQSHPGLIQHARAVFYFGYRPMGKKAGVPLTTTTTDAPHSLLSTLTELYPTLKVLVIAGKDRATWSLLSPALADARLHGLVHLSLRGAYDSIYAYLPPNGELANLYSLELRYMSLSSGKLNSTNLSLTLPALRRIHLIETAASFVLPKNAASNLSHVELYGTAASTVDIANVLYSCAGTLRVLHLIGRAENNALHTLELTRLTTLELLAVGSLQTLLNVQQVRLLHKLLPDTLKRLLVLEWDGNTITHYVDTFRGILSTGNLPLPMSLEEIHFAHAECGRPSCVRPDKDSIKSLQMSASAHSIAFEYCSLVPQPQLYSEPEIHKMKWPDRLRLIAAYLKPWSDALYGDAAPL